MSTELQFRPATLADTQALVALVESAYRGDVSKQGWTTEADLLGGRRTGADEIETFVTRPGSQLVLAERPLTNHDRELVGCAHVAVEDDAGYFGMFSVRPDLQGAGIGKALLAEAERVVRDEWKLPAIRMTVIDVREELIAFYERRGYIRTGIKKDFPYEDQRFGVPKRQDLRFEVLEKLFQPS